MIFFTKKIIKILEKTNNKMHHTSFVNLASNNNNNNFTKKKYLTPNKNMINQQKFTCQVPRPQHVITFERDSIIQLATMMERW